MTSYFYFYISSHLFGLKGIYVPPFSATLIMPFKILKSYKIPSESQHKK